MKRLFYLAHDKALLKLQAEAHKAPQQSHRGKDTALAHKGHCTRMLFPLNWADGLCRFWSAPCA